MRAELLTAANSLPMNLAAPPGPWFGGWMCWWLRGSGGRAPYISTMNLGRKKRR